MDIGTAEIIDEPVTTEKRRRGGISGGGNGTGSGGGKRGPGGGGSNGPDDKDDEIDRTAPSAEKSRILTYFLLLVVLMTFGGVIAAYVVIATNKAIEWNPFELPVQVWISTGLIALSSLAYFYGERATFAGEHLRAKRYLLGTTFLGATFISSQIVLWMELVARGVYAYGNPYAGFFYILTALHAAHVCGGIIALSTIVLRSWNAPKDQKDLERRQSLAQVVGWYWHMMGVLWLILIGLLGFWK